MGFFIKKLSFINFIDAGDKKEGSTDLNSSFPTHTIIDVTRGHICKKYEQAIQAALAAEKAEAEYAVALGLDPLVKNPEDYARSQIEKGVAEARHAAEALPTELDVPDFLIRGK